MNIVFKEVLTPGVVTKVRGTPLYVDMQRGYACLWFMPDEELSYDVHVVGTGIEIDAGADDYVGTFMPEGGNLVFHAFAIKEGR